MGTGINPYRGFVADMTSTEFEKYCLDALNAYAEKEGLKEFSILHDTKIQASDGIYQIDVYAEFTALGVKYKTIVECKKYNYPIEREKVSILANKVISLGAQKGILISTSGFQSGAVEYAKNHGISLLQILDKNIMHIQNSINRELDFIRLEFYRRMPKFYVYEYDYQLDFPSKRIYPTDKIVQKIREEITKELD